jgi:hypothetical protein
MYIAYKPVGAAGMYKALYSTLAAIIVKFTELGDTG